MLEQVNNMRDFLSGILDLIFRVIYLGKLVFSATISVSIYFS